MVNRKKYSTEELEQLSSEISPDKITICEKNNILMFYRADAYLSIAISNI